MRNTLLFVFTLLGASLCLGAEVYPSRTVAIIVPMAPGGGADITARLLAQQLSDQFKGSFVVVNKPGGGGITAARGIADAKPDGHMLFFAASAMTIAPYLLPNLIFDTERDLTPITEVASGALVMVVKPSILAKNPKELAAFAKEHPNQFQWGGTLGSPDFFSIARFNKAEGIKPLVVPFNGAGPTLTTLLSGEISAAFIVPTLVKDYVQLGKLRALAVASKSTVDLMPGVPTLASFGYTDFDSGLWYGLWGPKGMSKALATEIQRGVSRALAVPELQTKFKASGLVAKEANTPEVFSAYVSSEVKKNVAIIEEGKLRVAQ